MFKSKAQVVLEKGTSFSSFAQVHMLLMPILPFGVMV